MIQLQVLSGKTAGSTHAARRFPLAIGRAQSCHVRLEDDGVWDRHATLALRHKDGFFIKAEQHALLSVNGEPAKESRLRNGDEMTLGSARLRFWLAPARQRSLGFREAIVWITFALLNAGQIAVICWLSLS